MAPRRPLQNWPLSPPARALDTFDWPPISEPVPTTTCKFLHRHEATKGEAAYNDLLPNDYDKRQWNAMPTVRNSPTMPFVSQNCAGEFTGL